MPKIYNHHRAACGVPPAFTIEVVELYIGYFENQSR